MLVVPSCDHEYPQQYISELSCAAVNNAKIMKKCPSMASRFFFYTRPHVTRTNVPDSFTTYTPRKDWTTRCNKEYWDVLYSELGMSDAKKKLQKSPANAWFVNSDLKRRTTSSINFCVIQVWFAFFYSVRQQCSASSVMNAFRGYLPPPAYIVLPMHTLHGRSRGCPLLYILLQYSIQQYNKKCNYNYNNTWLLIWYDTWTGMVWLYLCMRLNIQAWNQLPGTYSSTAVYIPANISIPPCRQSNCINIIRLFLVSKAKGKAYTIVARTLPAADGHCYAAHGVCRFPRAALLYSGMWRALLLLL